MHSLISVPLLGKEIYIPHQPSHDSYLRNEMLIIEIDNNKDIGYFKKVFPLPPSEVIDTVRILGNTNPEDQKRVLEQGEKAKKETPYIQEEIKKLKLPMSLIHVYISSDDKILFISFISENRVDFRDLVRVLAQKYKRKIHMFQIGARDAARILDGQGICGRKLCCASHLSSPLPSVTMDAAREQNIAFKGPEALSGVCGKLKCCLNYETDQYRQLKKSFPHFGDIALYEGKQCTVIGLDILNERIKLKSEDSYLSVSLQDFKSKGESIKTKAKKPQEITA